MPLGSSVTYGAASMEQAGRSTLYAAGYEPRARKAGMTTGGQWEFLLVSLMKTIWIRTRTAMYFGAAFHQRRYPEKDLGEISDSRNLRISYRRSGGY